MSISLFLILGSITVLTLYFVAQNKTSSTAPAVNEDKIEVLELEQIEEVVQAETPAPVVKKTRAKSKKKPDLKVAK